MYILGSIILLIVLLATMPTINDLMSDPENIDEDDLGPIVGLLGGICAGVLLLFIMVIFFLIGLINIISGRDEFGSNHSNRSMLGFVFITIGFFIGIFSSMGGIYISVGISATSTIMYALGFIFLIEKLLDERKQKILWTAGILFMIIGIAVAIINLWLITTLDIDIENTEEVGAELADAYTTYLVLSLGLSSINLFPAVIFYYCYRSAENRIRSGELQPVMPVYPPPPAYGPYYPPPGAYPPPPGYPPPPSQSEPPEKCPSCNATIYYAGSKRCNNCGFYFE
jgi:hypothetical protein